MLFSSDLLESGVDSEYEEMGSKWTNNNPPGGPQCSQCVTVINVCPSPGHTLQPGAARHQPGHDPPYENLSFHKVTINVPDAAEDNPNGVYSEKPRVLLRKPPLRKSKVPLKYQGIKRVKSKSKTQKHEHVSHVSAGYSQKEVWNWLYLEEAAKSNGLNLENEESFDGEFGPDDIARMAREKSVSVQFSPVEFLQATNRLAHLNLEGFERFVGNTIDRALAGARAKSSDVLDGGDKSKENQNLEPSERDTDIYVRAEPSTAVRSCGHSKVRPVCESCLRSGDSSCSSALSSLESVKSSLSQGPRSRESDSSARGSYLSSDGGLAATTSTDYMRMSGQKIYRGNIRASLPVGGPSHKPYQTLEVSPEQGKTVRHQHSHHKLMMSSDAAGLVTLLPGHGQHHQLQLVDPGIQLHQQE